MKRWIALAAILVCIALLALVGASIVRSVTSLLGGADAGGEPDPMFAKPAEQVTRPPELSDGQEDAAIAHDASAGWVYEETSPVDQTPGELAALE